MTTLSVEMERFVKLHLRNGIVATITVAEDDALRTFPSCVLRRKRTVLEELIIVAVLTVMILVAHDHVVN